MNSKPRAEEPLKILMIGSQMALAGAQRVLLSQAAWFHARGHHVTAAFFYDKQDLHALWDKQYPFPLINLHAWNLASGALERYLLLARGLLRLYFLMRRRQFDVVEAYTPHSNLLAMVVAFFAGVPVRIATHHGIIEGMPNWLRRLHGIVVNSFLTTCMVAVSEQVKDMAVRLDGIRESKIVVINNGIEIQPEHASPEESRRHIFRELDLPPDSRILLAVGRLAAQKGHTYLLDAAPSILERHPNAVFAIAGVGELEHALRDKTRRLGLDRKVIFLGNRSDIYDFYAACDLFLMPSLWEGLPIAMLEAMSQSVPVVVADVEGIRAVIEHERSGLIIPSRDSWALVEAVDALLSDPAKMRDIGSRGAEIVRQHFSNPVMCASYQELFQDYLAR